MIVEWFLDNKKYFINHLKLKMMKLESLKLEKFENNALERKQMFKLNGGGTPTPGGSTCQGGQSFDYGYDSIRDGGVITYHSRKNLKAATC